MPSNQKIEFTKGAIDTIPRIIGAIPFGIIYGTLSQSSDLSMNGALALSSIVFAGSSQFVALGLIVSESQHMGVPSVVFKNTGSESIVEHKKTGYVAELKSTDDFIEGISWCLNNLNKKEKIINDLIKEKFKTQKLINDYLEFINT